MNRGAHKRTVKPAVRSSNARYVLVQASAQLAPVAAAPLITRLYSSADYGALGVFGASCALLAAVATGRYQRATLLAADGTEAIATTRVALGVSTLFCALVAAIEFVTYPLWHSTSIARSLGTWVYAIPAAGLLLATYDCFYHFSLRAGNLSAINRASVKRSVVNVGATLGLGLANWGASGTISGTVLSQVTSVRSLSRDYAIAARGVRTPFAILRRAAARHARFPKYDLWANLALVGTYNLIPLALAGFYSPAAVGLYSLAYRLLALPADLIGTSMGELYFRKVAAQRRSGGPTSPVFWRTLTVTGLAGLSSVVVAPFAPSVFGVVFGTSWREAGAVAAVMVPHVAARLAATPLFSSFAVFDRQHELLVGQVMLLVGTVVIFASLSSLTLTSMLLIHSCAMAGIYLALLARCALLNSRYGAR